MTIKTKPPVLARPAAPEIAVQFPLNGSHNSLSANAMQLQHMKKRCPHMSPSLARAVAELAFANGRAA